VLDISGNNIEKIEGLDGLVIQELNLSRNKLTSLTGLANLPRLSVLDVSRNDIASLGPLSSSSQLTSIDISQNSLLHVRQTEFLGDLQWLRVLRLTGNPCYRKHLYR
jgi:Leucine-rich repeat (LRR) protein